DAGKTIDGSLERTQHGIEPGSLAAEDPDEVAADGPDQHGDDQQENAVLQQRAVLTETARGHRTRASEKRRRAGPSDSALPVIVHHAIGDVARPRLPASRDLLPAPPGFHDVRSVNEELSVSATESCACPPKSHQSQPIRRHACLKTPSIFPRIRRPPGFSGGFVSSRRDEPQTP